MKTLIALLIMACMAGCSPTVEYDGIKYWKPWFGKHSYDNLLIEIKDPNNKSISIIIEGQKSQTELVIQAFNMGAKMGGGK